MKQSLKKSLIKISTVSFVIFFFASCSGERRSLLEPEFTVSTPVYKSAEEDDRCMTGGVYFDFYNRSETDVVFLEVRMNVYESDTGKAAFLQGAQITSESEVYVKAGEKRNMCISLDSYITVAPKAPYVIDQFYVRRIVYSDGSEWRDDAGLYAIGSGK